MRITFWGAGAVGGSIGAFLLRAGRDVAFIDRDREHVQAMREHGLWIDGSQENLRLQVAAATPDEVAGPLELVVLTVKSQHTREAAEQIAPLLAPDGVVLSLQNGLNHETVASVVGPEHTLAGLPGFSADLVGPGHVRFGSPGPSDIGEIDGRLTPRLATIRDLLAGCGPVIATDNILGYLWSKLALISILFGTALVDADVADVVEHELAPPLFGQAAREVLAVAHAAGVRPAVLRDFDPRAYTGEASELATGLAAIGSLFRGMLKTRSGYWRDLAVRKRRTEVDYQVGVVVRRGQDHGVPTPVNRGILDLIHEIEEGQRPQSWHNLAVLADRTGLATAHT